MLVFNGFIHRCASCIRTWIIDINKHEKNSGDAKVNHFRTWLLAFFAALGMAISVGTLLFAVGRAWESIKYDIEYAVDAVPKCKNRINSLQIKLDSTKKEVDLLKKHVAGLNSVIDRKFCKESGVDCGELYF